MVVKGSGIKKNRVVRDNASMGRVVFLRPEVVQPRFLSRSFFSHIFHGRPIIFAIVALVAVISFSVTVRGSAFDYYPETCIGSWKSPENAQGKPSIRTNLASLKQFRLDNSAVFFGGTHSIICQSFAGQEIPPEETLSFLSLQLSLAVKRPVAQAPVEEVPTGEGAGGSTSEEAMPEGGSDESEFTIVDEPVDGDDGWETAPLPEEQADVQVEGSDGATAEESVDAPEPSESSSPEVSPESSSSGPSESSPSESSSDSSASSGDSGSSDSSSGGDAPSAFFSSFVRKAVAQEATDILATVLYSVNDDEWQALGHITQESWQNLEFRIPVGAGGVTAVADIPKLRVRIDAGFFSIDNPIEIYLDGMTVEINTDEYQTEEERLEQLPEIGEGMGVAPVNVIEQVLSLDRSVIPTTEVLPWQPVDFRTEYEDTAKDITRSVATIDARTEDIILSGSCKRDYFTVLVFPTPTAYADAPRTALFNSAYPCDNGLYSYRLTPGLLKLKTGTYYLLVADQPEDGPWVPISALMPFSVEEQ